MSNSEFRISKYLLLRFEIRRWIFAFAFELYRLRHFHVLIDTVEAIDQV